MGGKDQIFMARALELAKLGAGWVDPNPMVGCVIADSEGNVIGEGWHKAFGGPHAEREALAECAARGLTAAGATVYVTLEPCCHWGKTPPCADALIDAGVARVVIGCLDVNPLVAGAGAAKLQAAGIEVETGVLEEQCKDLNRVFFHYMQKGRPYVVAKYASTLDGRIATRTGESKWITGTLAREHVHASRARYAAVMVGVGTVVADDPMLNCRLDEFSGGEVLEGARVLEGERVPPRARVPQNAQPPQGGPIVPHQPVRVVCDGHLRTPLDSKLVKTAREISVIIATDKDVPAKRLRPYQDAGCTVLRVSATDGRLNMANLMDELGGIKLDSVYVEGGPALLGSLLDSQLIDCVQAYIAPKLFGGENAPAAIGGLGAKSPQDCARIIHPQVSFFGEDILIEGEVRYG